MGALDSALQKLPESKSEGRLLTPVIPEGNQNFGAVVQKYTPPSFLNMNTIIHRNASLVGGRLEQQVRIYSVVANFAAKAVYIFKPSCNLCAHLNIFLCARLLFFFLILKAKVNRL